MSTSEPGADVVFDRERILSGRREGGRRRSLLFLVESFADPDGPDAAAVLDFLAATEVFGDVERPVLRDLLVHLEPVPLAAGHAVVAGAALHLVVHGRVVLPAEGPESGVRGPGEIFGAVALLADEGPAHPADHADPAAPGSGVWARRDSLLLRLSAGAFASFSARHPQALLGLCRQLLRVAGPSAVAPPVPVVGGPPSVPRTAPATTVAVLPAGTEPVPAGVVAALVAALGTIGPATALSPAAIEDALGPGAAAVERSDPRHGALLERVARIESAHAFVVWDGTSGETSWMRRCVRQADRVLLVARAGADPAPGPAERCLDEVPGRRRELALWHEPATRWPSGTSAWLAPRSVAAHHHVRPERAADLRRLARHVAGRACGLVLGGGGVRGFAHLGVMAALDEAGVEIDAVAGTSIGAIMAGLRAGELSHDERVETATAAMVRQGSMVPPTLPLVSYSSGAKVTRLLREVPAFQRDVEDLWLPFFCVSASLRRAEEVVHEHGPAWRAIRASIAIPGVFPPVPWGDELLVDGGSLNNVPVDLMADRLGSGPLVAVDLEPDPRPAREAAFGESLSGWRVLAGRVLPWVAPVLVPTLPDVLMRGLLLASLRANRAQSLGPTVALALQPPVGRGGLLDFSRGPGLVEPARCHTADVLAVRDVPAAAR